MRRTVDLWVVYELLKRLTTPFAETDAYRLGIIDDAGNVLRPQKSLTPAERQVWTSFDIVVNNMKRLLFKLPFGRVRFASYMAALWLLREPKAKTMTEAQLSRSFMRLLGQNKFKMPNSFPTSLDGEQSKNLKSVRVESEAWLHNLYRRGASVEYINTTTSGDDVCDHYTVDGVSVTFFHKPKHGTCVRVLPNGHVFSLYSVTLDNAYRMIKTFAETKDLRPMPKTSTRKFREFVKEDAPANAAATGAVAGLTGDPPRMVGVKRQKFAGHEAFEVNDDVWSRCRMGKKKHTRYDSYVGEDETGQAIRQYGLENPKAPIVLQHQRTGAFMYLRYGSERAAFDHVNPRRESTTKKKGKK